MSLCTQENSAIRRLFIIINVNEGRCVRCSLSQNFDKFILDSLIQPTIHNTNVSCVKVVKKNVKIRWQYCRDDNGNTDE